jgi:hypothetical protein
LLSNRDFIPSKVAFRIRDVIAFTLKVQGRSPELKLVDLDIEQFKIVDEERKKFDEKLHDD